jgi:polysaccharide biosynthesis protein PelA
MIIPPVQYASFCLPFWAKWLMMIGFLWLLPKGLRAEDSMGSPELRRDILAIIDDEDEGDLIHRTLEMVCNHYGFKIYYHLSDKPLPRDLSSYKAILTWAFDSDFNQAEEILQLFEKAQKEKVKLIFMGQLPAYIEQKSGNPLAKPFNNFLQNLGLQMGKYNLKNPLLMKVHKNTPELIDFEQQFNYKGVVFPNIESIHPQNSVALRVTEKQGRELIADLVVTAPWGGYALNPAVYQGKNNSPLKRWIINPFLFIEKALELSSYPIPDLTTWNGSRAIYCHIDGDAFNGICRFDKKRLCAEIIFDEVIAPYQFPHTLSLVHMWFDPAVTVIQQDTIVYGKVSSIYDINITARDREHWIKIAQRLFAPEWIEAGLHGYGHPLKWQERQLALRTPGKKFSLEDEIGLSLQIFEKTIPGKKTILFQWTGDCMPTEEAIEVCEKYQLININGGDSMFDQTFNSYIHVAPLYRQVGKQIQVYSSASNENIYTNEWQGPFYGFRNVIETFIRTESPKRISPINVYYHFYSGEMVASVKALQEVFEWANQQTLTPIKTTDYVKSVHAFLKAKFETTEHGWLCKDTTDLRTLRFENETRVPEVSLKRGVMGYLRKENHLYVHLYPSDHHEIYWTSQTEQPRLEQATCIVNQWSLDDKGLSVELWGSRPAVLTFQNLNHKFLPSGNLILEQEASTTRIRLHPQGHEKIFLRCLTN